jgi:DNA-binding transcriptional MocR family regulator
MTIWSPKLNPDVTPITRSLMAALRSDIDSGRLKPGDRLPTHRELADRLGVALGTITRVYTLAQREGLVNGEVGRGTFVRIPRSVEEDFAVRDGRVSIVDLSKNRVARDPGEAILSEGLADLASRPELTSLLDKYQPASGVMRHRKSAALWLSRPGFDVSADQILIASGAQHAINATLATLAKPGDTVVSESVTYPGIRAVTSLFHLRLLGLAIDEFGIIPESFRQACRNASVKVLYCVPTLHNPTAAIMPTERREEIADIAREFGVSVIEDDVYGFVPGESAPLPIAAYAPERTYYINSMSKSVVPGLRIGFVVAPFEAAPRIANAIYTSMLEAPPLMAELASTWILNGVARKVIVWKREEISLRYELALKLLGVPGKSAPHPSCHLWLSLPEPWRSEDFVAHGLARGVAISPSEAFVVGRGPAPHAVRICIGAPSDRGQLQNGLQILAEILRGTPEPGFSTV